jgi:hypothetical protein
MIGMTTGTGGRSGKAKRWQNSSPKYARDGPGNAWQLKKK